MQQCEYNIIIIAYQPPLQIRPFHQLHKPFSKVSEVELKPTHSIQYHVSVSLNSNQAHVRTFVNAWLVVYSVSCNYATFHQSCISVPTLNR